MKAFPGHDRHVSRSGSPGSFQGPPEPPAHSNVSSPADQPAVRGHDAVDAMKNKILSPEEIRNKPPTRALFEAIEIGPGLPRSAINQVNWAWGRRSQEWMGAASEIWGQTCSWPTLLEQAYPATSEGPKF